MLVCLFWPGCPVRRSRPSACERAHISSDIQRIRAGVRVSEHMQYVAVCARMHAISARTDAGVFRARARPDAASSDSTTSFSLPLVHSSAVFGAAALWFVGAAARTSAAAWAGAPSDVSAVGTPAEGAVTGGTTAWAAEGGAVITEVRTAAEDSSPCLLILFQNESIGDCSDGREKRDPGSFIAAISSDCL
jgi:hypothetical protein